MQLLLSFVETPPVAGAAPVWDALGDEKRAEVLAVLARLIARAAEREGSATHEEELREEEPRDE